MSLLDLLQGKQPNNHSPYSQGPGSMNQYNPTNQYQQPTQQPFPPQQQDVNNQAGQPPYQPNQNISYPPYQPQNIQFDNPPAQSPPQVQYLVQSPIQGNSFPNNPFPSSHAQMSPQAQAKPESFSRPAVAKWILDEKNMQRIDSMVGVAAGMLPIIVSIFFGIVGLGLGGLFFAYFVYRFMTNNKDITYIKQNYGL